MLISQRDAYKEILNNKARKGDLHKFFLHNNSLDSFIINIHKPHYKDLILNPFRNKDCHYSPACIYDIDEVLDLMEGVNFDETTYQACKFCNNLIRMSKFHGDQDLFDIIEEFWQKYNTDHITDYHSIKIKKDGNFKVLRKNSESTPILEIKALVKSGKLPNIKNFDKQELSILIENVLFHRYSDNIFEVFNSQIKKSDLMIFYKSKSLSEELICLICEYFSVFQKQNSLIYDKKYKNLHYFLVFKARSQRNNDKSIKMKQIFPKKIDKIFNFNVLLKHYRGLIILFQYEQRWFLSCFLVTENTCIIWDFIQKQLSGIDNEKLQIVMESIINENLEYKNKIMKFIQIQNKTVNPFSNKSLEAIALTYFIFEDVSVYPEYITFDENQIKRFSEKLLWLLLKLPSVSHEKIEFFNFLDQNNIEPNANLVITGQQTYKKPSFSNKNQNINKKLPSEVYNGNKLLGRLKKQNNMISEHEISSHESELLDQNNKNNENLNENKQEIEQKIEINSVSNESKKSFTKGKNLINIEKISEKKYSLQINLDKTDRKDSVIKDNTELKEQVRFQEKIEEIPNNLNKEDKITSTHNIIQRKKSIYKLKNVKNDSLNKKDILPKITNNSLENKQNFNYDNIIQQALLDNESETTNKKINFVVKNNINEEKSKANSMKNSIDDKDNNLNERKNHKETNEKLKHNHINDDIPKEINEDSPYKEEEDDVKTKNLKENSQFLPNLEISNIEKKNYSNMQNSKNETIKEILEKKPNLIENLREKLLENKDKIIPFLKEIYKSNLKKKIIKKLNVELNRMEEDFRLIDYLNTLEMIKKSYSLSTAPSWTLPFINK